MFLSIRFSSHKAVLSVIVKHHNVMQYKLLYLIKAFWFQASYALTS